MKTALITFYSVQTMVQTGFRQYTRVNNGFSFVRGHIEGDDILVAWQYDNKEELKRKLEAYDIIYCSLFVTQELRFIEELFDKRWIIGGPLFVVNDRVIQPMLAPDYNICRVIPGRLDDHLGIPYQDQNFVDYWYDKDLLGDTNILHYALPLGDGCYWRKCYFCIRRKSDYAILEKKNIKKIFSQIKKNNKYTNVSFGIVIGSVPGNMLREIIDNKYIAVDKGIHMMHMFTRADLPTLKIVKESLDLNNLHFALGVESFSEKIRNEIYNKGLFDDNLFTIMEVSLKKGATISITLMDSHPFMKKEYLKETSNNVDRMADIMDRYPNRVALVDSGRTYWDIEFLDRFKNLGEIELMGQGTQFTVNPKKNSEAEEAGLLLKEKMKVLNIQENIR